jgi:hypothetical protein
MSAGKGQHQTNLGKQRRFGLGRAIVQVIARPHQQHGGPPRYLPRPLLPGLPLFLLLQHPERLPRKVRPVHVLGIQDVAQLVAGEAIELGIVGVELGALHRPAVFVPLERWQRAAVR